MVSAYCPPCGPVVAGMIGGAVGAAANGGNIFQGAVLGAFNGAAALGGVFASAAWGGVQAEITGGSFGRGFLAAGVGAVAGGNGGGPKGFVKSAMLGGVTTRITGGKFANGAATAAFMWALRAGAHKAGADKSPSELSGKDKHYARNAENDAYLKEQGLYGRSDLTIDELGSLNFKHVGAPEDKYHTWGLGNENNQKWVFDEGSRYGSYEIVIRPEGSSTFMHVTDPRVMGTLNYGGNPWDHFWQDVVPYYRHGNSPSDPTTGWQRFRRTFE